MKLAVSNIAWPADKRIDAYRILADNDVHGLEIAPGLLFHDESNPFEPSASTVKERLQELKDHGLELVSMQSLLFGVEGANLFGDFDSRKCYMSAMVKAIELAGILHIPNLVVGSPRNRNIPATLDRDQAMEIALETFSTLGERARAMGCTLAMEPNPISYGTNFLNTVTETCSFVYLLNHPSVAVNFDLGSIHINNEFAQVDQLIDEAIPISSHVHLSEPELGTVPQDPAKLRYFLQLLRTGQWRRWISIEMRAAADGPLSSIEEAVSSCQTALKGQL